MTQVAELRWTPFFSLLRKEIKRFMRVIAQTVLVPLINSTLYLLIFGVSLGKNIQVYEDAPYLSFLIPGLVMMGVLNNAFQNSSSSIGTSKFHGDLEDLRIVPLRAWQILMALSVAALIRGTLVGFITFSVGEFFFWYIQGKLLGLAHPLLLLLFLVLGGFSFALVGIVVAFRAKNFDQMAAIGGFVLLPLMYLGGVFFPLNNLHPFWQGLSKLNPMLYFINGVRYSILGFADIPVTFSLTVASITLLVLSLIGLHSIRHGFYRRW
jgi:ABC-2 type transport system permease protein